MKTRVRDFDVAVGAEAAVEAGLRDEFDVVVAPPVTRTVRYLDTFDWRLWRGGTEMVALDSDEVLWRRLDGEELARWNGTAPEWADDLPPKAHQASRLVWVRRLFPVGSVNIEHRELTWLDGRQKTVLRGALETSHVGEIQVGARLVLRGVRGYDGWLERVASWASDALELSEESVSGLVAAARASGRAPGDYDSKPTVELDCSMRADAAMRLVYLRLLEVVETNEQGTKDALDIEFLHDFRVAIRRTRSGLSQVGDVFPSDVVATFKSEFKWAFSQTGTARDLDVYRLKMPKYREGLPERVSEALDALDAFLADRQREAQAVVVAMLSSRRWKELRKGWREFLEARLPDKPAAALATTPVGVVAAKKIERAWRRVLKKGRRIDDATPAEAVHELRIDAKKLRYLLEFFKGLAPEAAFRLVRDLKGLQDNLGDFNDYEVQQAKLETFAAEMVSRGGTTPSTLLAMGRLVDQLDRSQRREREQFAARFQAFDRPKVERHFAELFERMTEGA